MHRLPAGQSGTGGQGCCIGQGVLITECDDPLIVHHQEIENRPLEVNIPGTIPQIPDTRAGCVKECRKQFIIRRKPSQSLKREDLSGFLLHFFGFQWLCRPSQLGI